MTKFSVSDVTVVVVTFNSGHCIAPLAEGLMAAPHVVIVDNASADDTRQQVKAHLPQAIFLVNETNQGFGRANNRALALLTTRYALLLNPDCLPSPTFIDDFLEAAASFPEAAIVAPHLTRRGGAPEVNYRWPNSRWRSSGPGAEGPCCVGFICGAAMLVNMDLMRESVGFFDEDFFLYYEDDDLCERVFVRQLPMVLLPNIELPHLSRNSVRGSQAWRFEYLRGYHHAQSKLIFEHKHVGAGSAAALRWKTLGLAVLTLLPRLLFPQPKYLARLVGRIAGLIRPYPRGTLPIR